MRLGAVDAVGLLGHDVDPAALVAARETGVGASAGHVVEHRDVLGHANRIVGRQHDSELSDAQAPGLHPDIEVEQDRVVGNLEAFGVEVMLGEADRVVAEVVGQAGLRGNFAQHLVVQFAAKPNHPLFDLGFVADRRKIE